MSHCNGDAAIDQYLKAISRANKEFGNEDRRTVIIHAQTAREDQVKRFAEEKIFGIPGEENADLMISLKISKPWPAKISRFQSF